MFPPCTDWVVAVAKVTSKEKLFPRSLRDMWRSTARSASYQELLVHPNPITQMLTSCRLHGDTMDPSLLSTFFLSRGLIHPSMKSHPSWHIWSTYCAYFSCLILDTSLSGRCWDVCPFYRIKTTEV